MGEDVLTFEQLRNIQKQEQDDDTLTLLDDDFFDKANDYLGRKKRIGDYHSEKEYREAKHIVEDIVDSRQKKIIRLAFLSTKAGITVDNLLPEEELLFDKVQESITEHRKMIERKVFEDEEGTALIDQPTTTDEDEEAEAGEGTGDGPGDTTATTDTGEGERAEQGPQEELREETADRQEEGEDEPGDGASTDEPVATEGPDRPETAAVEDETEDDDDGEDELLFGGDSGTGGGSTSTDQDDGGKMDGDEEDTPSDDVPDGKARIRVTGEVPEFMGVDLESYGPFESGDKVIVPEDNADVLVEQGNAEILS